YTRIYQTDLHPSICRGKRHGKRGCRNNFSTLFKVSASGYNTNLMTLGKGLTFFFFRKTGGRMPRDFQREWPLRSENQDMETF
ncbi:MAG: hypothetical protein PUB12_10135, partial [[Clostridium] aminophilum]|uniref:hypothetical protein n=1 Tax=[Clostridium] aminophilum TaxID=1526 RepID=UPI0026E97AEA